MDSGDTLPPGARLNDKYIVGRLLGRGGFGATYVAWDDNLRVRVAIKEYLPRTLAGRTRDGTQVYAYTGDKEAYDAGLKQFLSEAQNLARFRTFAGIVAVLDYFAANGTGYMVMEHLEGCTLQEHVTTTGPLDPKLALGLVIPVAVALSACHATGLIHRDVSPDNIFITEDDHVKLIDFGAARVAASEKSINLSVILKEGYAPFEQYQRNGRQGPWTDVYALTGTLYRLLTGDLPPTAPDRAGGAALPTLADVGVRAPASLQALLDKGLAMAIPQRHQTIAEFLNDLRQAYDELDRVVVKLETGKRPAVDRKLGRNRAIAAAVAVLVVPAVAWAIITTGGGKERPVSPAPTPTQQPAAKIPPPGPVAVAPVPIEPKPVDDSEIEALRYGIRQALETHGQLQGVSRSIESGAEVLRKLEATSATPTMQAIVDKQRGYNAADVAKRERLVSEYVGQVGWLASHDVASVRRAFQLQRGDHVRPTADADRAAANRWAAGAMSVLEGHVAERRAGQLARDAVLRDVAARRNGTDEGAGA